MTDKSTYCEAWREYFWAKQDGVDYRTAINKMIARYGGVAKKQAISGVNGIYFNELNRLVIESMSHSMYSS